MAVAARERPKSRPRAMLRRSDRTATSGPSPRGTASKAGASPPEPRSRGRRPATAGWAAPRIRCAEHRKQEAGSCVALRAAGAGDSRPSAPAAPRGARSGGPADVRRSRRNAGCAGWDCRRAGSRPARSAPHAGRGSARGRRGPPRWHPSRSSAERMRGARAARAVTTPWPGAAPGSALRAEGQPIRSGAAWATPRERQASARTPGNRPDGWDCRGCTCCKSRGRMGQRRAVDRQGG
jgi:hypothetical protein